MTQGTHCVICRSPGPRKDGICELHCLTDPMLELEWSELFSTYGYPHPPTIPMWSVWKLETSLGGNTSGQKLLHWRCSLPSFRSGYHKDMSQLLCLIHTVGNLKFIGFQLAQGCPPGAPSIYGEVPYVSTVPSATGGAADFSQFPGRGRGLVSLRETATFVQSLASHQNLPLLAITNQW